MAEEIANYNKKAEESEKEIQRLSKEILTLKSILNRDPAGIEDSPEIARLIVENSKLKHRISILKRALEAETSIAKERKTSHYEYMPSIVNLLEELFAEAIKNAFPDLPNAPVVLALCGNNVNFGDYQCNSALPIANLYKTSGKKISPREIATKIVEHTASIPLINNLEIAGPGFINIFLSRSFAVETLSSVLKNGILLPPLQKKMRILVDFSAPNIAKEMHVGHLRSTIIGDSISRLLEFLGHDVLRVNHIGDWGTQFGMLIAHLKEMFPDYVTKSPPIGDLQSFYKESKKRFDEDEVFKKEAYNCVVKLQSYDPDYHKAWDLICNVSRKEFQKIYDRLEITLTEKGESFYQSRMEAVVEELKKGGFLEEDEGRLIMWSQDSKLLIPLTIVKSDGGFTYDTSDMAAIKYRLHEEKADWIIYVTDAGQATHFQLIEACARRAGILNSEQHKISHVGFGVVLGEDKKKFKTRSGETVRLVELLEEGLKRSLNKLKEKEREKFLTPEELKTAQESIAYGCIKYADLSLHRIHEYVFSFDKMLDDKGNTAVYLLYAFTRIQSISRNANLTPQNIADAIASVKISLNHDKEWKLGKVLLRFPDVLLKITKDLCLHHLCEYVYEISTTFSEFYDSCYCVERNADGTIKQVNLDRILLSEVTAMILRQCFSILGLKPVSRM